MDYLAEVDRLIAEANSAAQTLPDIAPLEGAGERLVQRLIAAGVITSREDLYALYGAVVERQYNHFLVRQQHAAKIIDRLRAGEMSERSRKALVDQLQRLDEEMTEMVNALEDVAEHG